MKIASMIDHTILAAGATAEQIGKLCREAVEYGFASVCVNSCRVPQARALLADSSVKVCTVVGFPLGAMSTKAKAYEAAAAVEDGADEVDMVINIGYVKDGAWDSVLDDIKAVRKACGDKVLKVILETCLLTDDETAVHVRADEMRGGSALRLARLQDALLMPLIHHGHDFLLGHVFLLLGKLHPEGLENQIGNAVDKCGQRPEKTCKKENQGKQMIPPGLRALCSQALGDYNSQTDNQKKKK